MFSFIVSMRHMRRRNSSRLTSCIDILIAFDVLQLPNTSANLDIKPVNTLGHKTIYIYYYVAI